jgi:endoglucanase
VSLRGFYYMRVGEAAIPGISPVPRQPRFIPRDSPPGMRILLTSMGPNHPAWKTFAPGDPWDPADRWAAYVKPGKPENMKAIGGHADALDWDRHLGHVSLIYDLLLPFYITGGLPADDDTGIAESGNGIPDIIDEARNEVDFWLALRDGEGYSCGLTNPDKGNVLYQAENTTLAAWANAANASMLASCLGIAGKPELRGVYLAEARKAWDYAERQADPELDRFQELGDTAMRGKDLRMTAAAFLFDLSGEKVFEDAVAEASIATDGTTDPLSLRADQGWATAGYLFSKRVSSRPGLREAMAASVMRAAKAQAALTETRPSRRASDPATWYFHTAQNVHRLIIAHALTPSGSERDALLRALLLEADWGLGRNPLNMVQMTTAFTPLAGLRSVENAYTSGRRDGFPGMHPGHTPYLNADDWGTMIMAKPGWMASLGYPSPRSWPRGEIYFNTRWVWAHSEFTPQQTMRGKMALYAYLYALGL